MRERLVRTFGFRLAVWYFGLFAGGTALVLVLAYALLARSLAERDREIVESTMDRYVRAYLNGGLRGLEAAVVADRAGSRYEPLFVRVVTPSGQALYFSMPADWNRFDLSQLSRVVDEDGWGELSMPDSDEQLAVRSRTIGGRALFQVGRSTHLRNELLARFRGAAALLVVAVVVAGLAGGRALAGSALQPIRQLAATVRSILEGGPTSARVPVRQVNDELDELGVLMNRMLDRIDALIDAMRSSLDHVAHDLRTPVTRLRGIAETALRSNRSEAEYRAALADSIEESERVTGMLDALMDLAEAEAGTMALRLEPLDVAAVLRDATDLYTDVAAARRVTLSADVPEQLLMTGDRNRLAQVFANLLDNAVKYTAAGGRIDVTATKNGGVIAVVVADTGIGIPPDELPRIWDRLFRGDRSRSERGLGLGLSLVKAIVERHGGRVDVASRPGEGSRFSVELPAERLT